ncbi:MAG: phosphatidylglycerophosphatase A family protein [Methylomicrobium sp.]
MNIFHKTGLGQNQLTARQIMTDPALFLAFGFGSGLARKAPGTLGTAAAIPLYWLLIQTGLPIYSVSTVVATLAGIWICGIAADKLGEHDFSGIVWDEVAGYLITMWLVPFSWKALLLGFVLFRIFDILKPWPISWIDQKVQGGLGIMLDDVVAGVFAGALLWAAVQYGWV